MTSCLLNNDNDGDENERYHINGGWCRYDSGDTTKDGGDDDRNDDHVGDGRDDVDAWG